MSVSLYKIRKWYLMMTGRSIHHVNQGRGKYYSKTEISGYYNDLREKITKDPRDLSVPTYTRDYDGKEAYFSIGIFQYGLAANDMYIESGDDKYLEKLRSCADWAVSNQEESGGWLTFQDELPLHPYSSMAQGEGISLLLRAYIRFGDEKYLRSAEKAKAFMVLPLSENGGTTVYDSDDVYFYEYCDGLLVLNGWIFSLWGLYDYWKFFKKEEDRILLEKTLSSLERKLPSYDNGYWSLYDDRGNIASPSYHKIHIAQLEVMYDLFGRDVFREYADKWETYGKSFFKSRRAFIVKAFQKIFE